MEKLFLIDGNHLVHRSFYAIRPLFTKSGTQTNAVFGFFSILLNLIEKEKPKYLAVTFDEKAPTFRHKEHKEYKATRTKAPDELYTQIPMIKEVLSAFDIPFYSIEGFEADDLLGTFSRQANEQDIRSYIITGDHDALQLVDDDRIFVVFPHKGYREPIIFNEEKVFEKFGVTPKQMIDYKGLCGDSSDNLKGVQGIGPKGAQRLIQTYGSVEGIYENLNELKGKEKEKLEKDRDSAFQCKELARIILDVPMELKIEECHLHDFDLEKLSETLDNFELFSIKNRVKRIVQPNKRSGTKIEKKTNSQMSLF